MTPRQPTYPTDTEISPSAARTYRACPRRWAFERVAGRGREAREHDPGGYALVGTLCHRALERAGRLRLRRPDGTRSDPETPDLADAAELAGAGRALGGHLAAVGDDATTAATADPGVVREALATARRLLRAEAPVDLGRVALVEHVVARVPWHTEPGEAAPWTWRGILDRVDLWECEPGVYAVEVVDYKTGAPRPSDELRDDPQTVLYGAWAAAWATASGLAPEACRVAVVYSWVGTGRTTRLRVDADLLERGIARLAREHRARLAGRYPARVGPACASCPHADLCDEHQARVRTFMLPAPEGGVARVAWRGLPTSQLAVLRHAVDRGAAERYALRRELDAEILARLDADLGPGERSREYRDPATGSGVRVTRRADAGPTTYGPEAVPVLARATGRAVADLVAELRLAPSAEAVAELVRAAGGEGSPVGRAAASVAERGVRAPHVRTTALDAPEAGADG